MNYATDSFELNAELQVNGNRVSLNWDLPMTTNCDGLTDMIETEIDKTGYPFILDSFYVDFSEMSTSAMNNLIYCFAHTPKLDEDGYDNIYFANWSSDIDSKLD